MTPKARVRTPLCKLLLALASLAAVGACGGGGGSGSAEAATAATAPVAGADASAPVTSGNTAPGGAGSAGTAPATATAAAAAWGSPRTSARLFVSGHSLTDNPLADHLLTIASSLGNAQSAKYNEQIAIGSPLRMRTDPAQNRSWTGYSQGKNRSGSNMNVISELASGATIGGDRYDTLVITERHDLLQSLQWESTVRYLRHFHERLITANPQGRTYFYESWFDLFDKANPAAWIAHERAASSAWQCIGTRINTSLAAEGRSDRIRPLPAGAAIAALVERSTGGNTLAGVSGANTTETVNRIFRDAVHMTDLGMYYLAAVTYAAVYERSPVGAAAPSGISSTQARSLQETAWAFVSNFYANQAAPDLASCRAAVATNFCPVYWSYRNQPGNAAGCTSTFSAQTSSNPLYYSASSDAAYWFPAP